MSKFPMPEREGYFWAKLVNVREGTSDPKHFGQSDDDLKSVDWEVVRVNENYTGPDRGDDEKWSVSVPGIELVQWAVDFVWGPEVPQYIPSKKGETATKQSSAELSSLAAKYMAFSPSELADFDNPEEGKKVASDIRRLAASVLSQDERKG